MPNNIVYESNYIGNIYDNNCHHIAVTRHLDELKFYFDKQLVGTSSTGVVVDVNSTENYCIGVDRFTKYSNFYGNMDNFMIWNYARIEADFNAAPSCFTGSETGLLALLRFDHNPSIQLHDFSSNSVLAKCNVTDTDQGPSFDTNLCGAICPPYDVLYLADSICIRDPNSYACGSINIICNGEFEQGAPISLVGTLQYGAFSNCNSAGTSSEVTNWCGGGTPEYFARGCTFSRNDIPTNSIVNPNLATNPRSIQCTNIDTWNGPGNNNDRYAVLKGGDAIYSALQSFVFPNQTYQLNFRALSIYGVSYNILNPPNPPTQPILKFSLRNNSGPGAFNIGVSPIASSCNWQQYSLTFTTSWGAAFNEIYIQGSNLGSSGDFFIFLDDIELFSLTNNFPIVGNGVGSHRPNQLAVDNFNNIYVAGNSSNSTITWPGSITSGPNTGFLTSFNSCGNVRWAQGVNDARGVAYSAFGGNQRLYVSNFFSSLITIYNANTGVFSTLTLNDPFITEFSKLKFYASGRYLFAMGLDASGSSYIIRIDVSPIPGPNLRYVAPYLITDFDVISPTDVIIGGMASASVAHVEKVPMTAPQTPYNVCEFTCNDYNFFRLNTVCIGNTGTFAVGGNYGIDAIAANSELRLTMHNGIPVNVLVAPGGITKTGLGYNAWSAIISSSTSTPIASSYFGGDNLYSWISSCVFLNSSNEFVSSGVHSNTTSSTTNLPYTLGSTNSKRNFIAYKQSATNGNNIWYNSAVSSGTGFGSTTMDMVIGNSNNIYAAGYIMGSLDFQQGDVITANNNCDNVWVCNIDDNGATADFTRLQNTSKSSTPPKSKGLICSTSNCINAIAGYDSNNSSLYSITGKLLIRNNVERNFESLSAGTYILHPNTNSLQQPIIIIKP